MILCLAICWILPIIVGILIIFGSQHFGDITIDDVNNQTFDYIIIGGGTAGTVLANRLSANANISVLLIEAGDEFNLISRVPFLATLLQKTDVDWQYQSTPQEHSSIGFNKCVGILIGFLCHKNNINFNFIVETKFATRKRSWWLQSNKLHASFRYSQM